MPDVCQVTDVPHVCHLTGLWYVCQLTDKGVLQVSRANEPLMEFGMPTRKGVSKTKSRSIVFVVPARPQRHFIEAG